VLCIILALPLFQLVFSVLTQPEASVVSGFSVFDSVTLQRLWNSVQLACWDVFFSALFAIPVYWVYLHASSIWRSVLFAVAVIPFTFPAFATASSWMVLLARIEQGSITRVIWGAQSQWTTWLYSIPGCGFILSLHDWAILFLCLALTTRLHPHQIDASCLYISKWKTFYYVLLPAWKLPLAFGSGIIFVLALSHFETASLLQIDVYPLEIYTRFSTLLNLHEALMLCLPYLFLSGGIVFFMIYFSQLFHTGNHQSIQLRGKPYFSLLLFCLIVVTSIVIPLCGFLAQTSIVNVFFLLGEQQNRIFNSMNYALCGSIFILLIGLIFTKHTNTHRSLLYFMLIFLFFAPGILLAAGVLELRSWLPFVYPGWFSRLTLLYAFFCHFGLAGFIAGKLLWQHYGYHQMEYETLLQIPFKTKFWHLYVPHFLIPSVKSIAVISLLVWSDVAMTVLLHPPGGETLTVYYYNQLHYGSDSRTAAAGMLLMLVPMLTIGFVMGLIVLLNQFKKKAV
jgi:ABC-type Fe3+ transport system permease subunit